MHMCIVVYVGVHASSSECAYTYSSLANNFHCLIPYSPSGAPPTLAFTAEVVSDTQVNISVTATVANSPCPDNVTRYIVSATNAVDSSMVVSKTYFSIPQGEVLSGLNPSTSYHIVVAVQTVSGVVGHSNTRTVTTLQSG